MTTEESHPTRINDNELLARFVVFRHWLRNDNTVKPDAFMPHPQTLDLSVFLHIGLTSDELWNCGHTVIQNRKDSTLYGRADILTLRVRGQNLEVSHDAPPQNHAVITGWSNEKPNQKILAMELAAESNFVLFP
jgi:hypothetical protein